MPADCFKQQHPARQGHGGSGDGAACVPHMGACGGSAGCRGQGHRYILRRGAMSGTKARLMAALPRLMTSDGLWPSLCTTMLHSMITVLLHLGSTAGARGDSFVYVVGPRGSGKTTLLNRFLHPSKVCARVCVRIHARTHAPVTLQAPPFWPFPVIWPLPRAAWVKPCKHFACVHTSRASFLLLQSIFLPHHVCMKR